MTEAEALDMAIQQMIVSRDQSEENLYGRRYKDRSKHPDREVIEEILSVKNECIAILTALRDRVAA